jgi:hypothetical protein
MSKRHSAETNKAVDFVFICIASIKRRLFVFSDMFYALFVALQHSLELGYLNEKTQE